MKIDIYTFTKKGLDLFGDLLPDYVHENVDKRSIFTLGAVENKGEDSELLGMIQFRTNITDKSSSFVEIICVYVMEEFRRVGIGSKLVDRARSIAKKSGIDVLTILLPADNGSVGNARSTGNDGNAKSTGNDRNAGSDIYAPISSKEAAEFFEELGFTKVDVNLNLYETVLTEIQPELLESPVERYSKFLRL